MAALAALAGLTDFLSERQIRRFAAAWSHMIGNVIVMLIELFNLWQRIELGGAFIVPLGLILSAVATVLLIFNGWMGWHMVYRHGSSEEHTSELQSLIRISYAVFCLKKKIHVHRQR